MLLVVPKLRLLLNRKPDESEDPSKESYGALFKDCNFISVCFFSAFLVRSMVMREKYGI